MKILRTGVLLILLSVLLVAAGGAIAGDGRLKGVLDLRVKQGRRLLAAWGARSGREQW